MTDSEQLEIITKLSKITTLPQRGVLLKYKCDYVNPFGDSVKAKALCFDMIDTYKIDVNFRGSWLAEYYGVTGSECKDLKTAVILAVLNKFNKG